MIPSRSVNGDCTSGVTRRVPSNYIIITSVSGESSFLVPDTGAVFLRFIARRDVPIVSRHTVLVHRWHEPPPTMDDLDRALEKAFPGHRRIDLREGSTA